MVELAILLPFLGLLLMGAFDAGIMAADKVTSVSAARQGARLAAELGGLQTNPGATTSDIDRQIVDNVLASSSGLSAATLQEIDIYLPSRSDGSYQPGVDLVDQYLIDSRGRVRPGTQTFPITLRTQTPPTETSIGVRLVWSYDAPAGVFPRGMILSDYSVMKAAPVLV